MKSLFGPSDVVGIAVDRDEVRSLAVSVTMRGVEIAGLARAAVRRGSGRSEEEAILDAMEELKGSWETTPEWLVTELPSRGIVVRRLRVPKAGVEAANNLVKYEMEPHLPFQVDEAVVDFISRDPGDNGMLEVLAMAAGKSDVRAHLDLFDRASLECRQVGAVGMGAYLAYRFAEKGSVDQEGVAVLVDYRKEATHLVAFDSRGPLLTRSLEMETVSTETEPPVDRDTAPDSAFIERLAAEIKRTGLQIRARIQRIVLVVSEAADERFLRELEKHTEIPCGTWNPLKSFPVREGAVQEDDFGAGFVSILGIAATATFPASKRIDFRRDEFQFKKPLTEIKGKLTYLSVICFLILVFLGANFWLQIRTRSERLEGIKTEIRRVYKETFPEAKTIVSELQQMKTAIDNTRESLTALGFRPGRIRTLELLSDISKRIPENSGIRITEMSIEPDSVRMSGEAGSFEAIDGLKERLMGIPGITSVQVEEANQSRFGKVIEFSLRTDREGAQ